MKNLIKNAIWNEIHNKIWSVDKDYQIHNFINDINGKTVNDEIRSEVHQPINLKLQSKFNKSRI